MTSIFYCSHSHTYSLGKIVVRKTTWDGCNSGCTGKKIILCTAGFYTGQELSVPTTPQLS